jgi:hypothetical protein
MRLALAAVLLVACADDSSGGPDVTTRVETLIVTPGNPGCFKNTPADADPTTPGSQYDCSVTKTANGAVYAQCNDMMTPTNPPCWTIGPNGSCVSTLHFELRILPSVTEGVTAQCLVN